MSGALERVRQFLSVECPEISVQECVDDLADLEIPAAHPDVGPLLIQVDDDEITFFLGEHTHCHFDLDQEHDAHVFLRAVLTDQIVIWSGLLAGGTRQERTRRRFRLPWVREFLWSGPYSRDAA